MLCIVLYGYFSTLATYRVLIHFINPDACWRVLWILFVRNCTVYLVFCFCLLNPTLPGGVPRHCRIRPLRACCLDARMCWAQLCRDSFNTHWTSNVLLLFPLYCCCVCNPFAGSFLMSNASYGWSVTCVTFLCMLFPKTLAYTLMRWFKLQQRFTQKRGFA